MEKGHVDMSFSWIEDSDEQIPAPMKVKRKVKQKKMEFVGWGSKALIDFLEYIGKDYSKQLTQYEVAAIIKEYVNRHNLLHPVKKKKIVCDDWLYSLFGKKLIPRIKIYDLLEEHFTENHDSSEDDLFDSSGDEAVKSSGKKRKITYEKKQVPKTSKSCFVAIVPENIKLLYLKRSLVQELMKNTETFESKVVGSYVRIKSDPNDYSQKHSHQLVPVTGVIRESSDEGDKILLQVPNVIKAIPLRLLTEENFSEEECEDLRQRVKDGLIRRTLVVDFEQKARFLHEDITKHWLERELSLLRNLMDRANEKGWRREKYEYSERIQLLETPAEKARLLLEVPKVIADELERDPTLQEPIENVEQEISTSLTSVADEIEPNPTLQAPINNAKQGISCSPTSILRGASVSSADLGANQSILSLNPDAEGSIVAAIPSQDTMNGYPVDRESKSTLVNGIKTTKTSIGILNALKTYELKKLMEVKPASVIQQQNRLCMPPTRNENSIGMQAAFETYELQNIMGVKPASVIQQQNGLCTLPTRNENSNRMQAAFETDQLQKIMGVKPASVIQQRNGLCMLPTRNENTNKMQAAFETDQLQKIMEVKPASVVHQQNKLWMPTMNERSIGMQAAWFGGANDSQKEEDKRVSQVIDSKSKVTSVNGITSTNGSTGLWAALEPYDLPKIAEVKQTSIVLPRNELFTPTMTENSTRMQAAWFGGAQDSKKVEEKKVSQVIELSDDEEAEEAEEDEEDEEEKDEEPIKDEGFQFKILEHPESKIWYYMDPQGQPQGPFTMSDLKAWYDAKYFTPDFKVWRREQNPGQAVLLTDLLSQMFPDSF